MPKRKICIDCKYSSYDTNIKDLVVKMVCNHPELVDLVTGQPVLCSIHRSNERKDSCGTDARFFEVKDA